MPVGQPRNYYKKFKFLLEIDGFDYAGFSTMSPLKKSVGVVEHREGGTLLPDKTPGLMTVDNITLARGATKDMDLWNWFEEVANVANNQGTSLANSAYAKEAALVQQDMDGSVLMRWEIKKAWPMSFNGGEWDNSAEEVVLHEVELVVERFTPVQVSGN